MGSNTHKFSETSKPRKRTSVLRMVRAATDDYVYSVGWMAMPKSRRGGGSL